MGFEAILIRCNQTGYKSILSAGQKIRQDKGYPMDNLDEQDYFIFHHGKS